MKKAKDTTEIQQIKATTPYIIFAPDYREDSEGVKALHRLCHTLNEKGCNAYVSTSVVNTGWNTPHINNEEATKKADEGAICVYPDIVQGNPFNGKNIARYVLSQPGLHGGDTVYGPDDTVFAGTETLTEYVPDAVVLDLSDSKTIDDFIRITQEASCRQ